MLKNMYPYIKPYIPRAILALIISFIVSTGNASPVYFIKLIIDKALSVENGSKYLIISCISLLAMIIIKGLFYYLQIYISSTISSGIIRDLRISFYKKIIYYPIEFFHKYKSSDIISRLLTDIGAFQNIVQAVITSISDVGLIIILLLWVFYINVKFTLITMIIIPVIGYIIKAFSRKIKRLSYRLQEQIGNINTVLYETLIGIKEIKSYLMEKYQINRFDNVNNNSYITSIKNIRVSGTLLPIVEFFNTLSLTIILFLGGRLVLNGEITKGDLLSFLTALGIMFTPIKRLTGTYTYIQQAVGIAKRLFEIMEYNTEDIKEEKINYPINGEIHFKDVSFSYNNKDTVLKNINLHVKQGEIIAIVGKSGAGKTTLVNLIPGFYKITKGNIYIDERDLNEYTLYELRSQIAIIPQENFLFQATVLENITMGKNFDMEKVVSACKSAHAHDFIMALPQGYYTVLQEHGKNLSGGQRQRIAIARLILKSPRILLLDEATSALDNEAEYIVQNALYNLMRNRTSFIIAHRLSTIIHADRIIVMDNGRIVETGTHSELLKRDGLYAKLYNTQFKTPQEKVA